MGTVRRPGPGCGPLRPAGRPVLLVTRDTVAAAGRAVAAARLLGEQRVPVVVLVVIGDGLPEPAEARYRFGVLDGHVGAVVRVPFVPAFRIAADPLSVTLPRRARRALAEIRALACEQMPYPAPETRPLGEADGTRPSRHGRHGLAPRCRWMHDIAEAGCPTRRSRLRRD